MKIRSMVQPQPIEITTTTVFVNSNIHPYEETVDGKILQGYEYDCIDYTKDEYLIKLTQENARLKQDIIDTQLALVELYEAGDVE